MITFDPKQIPYLRSMFGKYGRANDLPKKLVPPQGSLEAEKARQRKAYPVIEFMRPNAVVSFAGAPLVAQASAKETDGISDAGRKRLSEAMKARWAAAKAGKGPVPNAKKK